MKKISVFNFYIWIFCTSFLFANLVAAPVPEGNDAAGSNDDGGVGNETDSTENLLIPEPKVESNSEDNVSTTEAPPPTTLAGNEVEENKHAARPLPLPQQPAPEIDAVSNVGGNSLPQPPPPLEPESNSKDSNSCGTSCLLANQTPIIYFIVLLTCVLLLIVILFGCYFIKKFNGKAILTMKVQDSANSGPSPPQVGKVSPSISPLSSPPLLPNLESWKLIKNVEQRQTQTANTKPNVQIEKDVKTETKILPGGSGISETKITTTTTTSKFVSSSSASTNQSLLASSSSSSTT